MKQGPVFRGRPRKLHFNDLFYLLRLIRLRLNWFLDELLELLTTNRFIFIHLTTMFRDLERFKVSKKKLRRIAKK